MITVDAIKAAAAGYWRYTRQCPLIAFEAELRGERADILAVDQDRFLIETEVKVDMGDFRRDKEKLKHKRMTAVDGRYPVNYFYFAVPKQMANKVGYICDQLYPYAGVLGVSGNTNAEVDVYRKGKRLKEDRLTFLQISRMAKAQSATLCRLARDLSELRQRSSREQETR